MGGVGRWLGGLIEAGVKLGEDGGVECKREYRLWVVVWHDCIKRDMG